MYHVNRRLPNNDIWPVCCRLLWKTLLLTSNFSFFQNVFCPIRRSFFDFITFWNVVCKLYQFGIVENMVFGVWVKLVKAVVDEGDMHLQLSGAIVSELPPTHQVIGFLRNLFSLPPQVLSTFLIPCLTLYQRPNFRLSQIERVCRRHFKVWCIGI